MIRMDRNSINANLRVMPRGFGFRPTDEELLTYYLKPKMDGRDSEVDNVINEVDILKHEPWDLPSFSAIQSTDNEWFFFSPRNKKYTNSERSDRTTEHGYWKPTCKARDIMYRGNVIGTKKTLVYHKGRHPKGKRTDWKMHEYHPIETLPGQKAFVLCRLKKKHEQKTSEKGGPSSSIAPPEAVVASFEVGGPSSSIAPPEAVVASFEVKTPPPHNLLPDELGSLLSPGSPPHFSLILEPVQRNDSSVISEGGLNIQFDTCEDEEDVEEFLNSVIAEEDEVSGTRVLSPKLDRHAYYKECKSISMLQVDPLAFDHDQLGERYEGFLPTEVDPLAFDHDQLEEGYEGFLPTEVEESDRSSDDSSTNTPQMVMLQSSVYPVSRQYKAGEAADLVSPVQAMKRNIIRESRSQKASFIVFDTPRLTENPSSVYFLNCVIAVVFFIVILRDMVFFG